MKDDSEHGIVSYRKKVGDVNERRLREALSVLEGYEKLEADLIMCDEVWDTESGLPQLPERFYVRFVDLQVRRNDVLGRFQAGQPNPAMQATPATTEVGSCEAEKAGAPDRQR